MESLAAGWNPIVGFNMVSWFSSSRGALESIVSAIHLLIASDYFTQHFARDTEKAVETVSCCQHSQSHRLSDALRLFSLHTNNHLPILISRLLQLVAMTQWRSLCPSHSRTSCSWSHYPDRHSESSMPCWSGWQGLSGKALIYLVKLANTVRRNVWKRWRLFWENLEENFDIPYFE
ncbi:hypothetical protein SELMODRAFT_413151 [Selaginella moellendorffii]|uniref:Uncharacterized protein n=1 Tax=Selaginella moellendorffii TaxID=88036 RepID=D8RNI3_SELML|nr:hypothetical protein SELMODRAFT_413151 [Selaginella moellendorffii]